MNACGARTQTQVVKQSELVYIKVPPNLLETPPLQKPKVVNELDIINAYSYLFYHYKKLENQLKAIQTLQNDGAK
ncbi:hypothetical protein [Campylobacter sp. MIT 12-8780]|uniref:hypothetical protein n=1 Tax=Campylobacter sp. MIT 12-8780 TaxID=2202200 RepID=UPI003FA46CBD